MSLSNGVRRVVTTNNDEGRAVVLFDSVIGEFAGEPLKTSGVRQYVFWLTEGMPGSVTTEDVGARPVKIPPPKNGTIFRMVDFPPEGPEVKNLPNDHMHKILGDTHRDLGVPSRHPFMHRTETIDYAIIIAGEIDMMLDDEEVHLKAGDVVVQQSTNHAWVNRSGDVCRICFILTDGDHSDHA